LRNEVAERLRANQIRIRMSEISRNITETMGILCADPLFLHNVLLYLRIYVYAQTYTLAYDRRRGNGGRKRRWRAW